MFCKFWHDVNGIFILIPKYLFPIKKLLYFAQTKLVTI